MNVLMIAQYFPPDKVGTSTRAYNAAKGLKLMGYNITVVTAFPHYPHGDIPGKYRHKIISHEELEGIKIIRTWVPRISHSSNLKRVVVHTSFMLSSLLAIRFVKKRVDVIFAMNPAFFSFFSALIFKFLFRKNIIRNVDDLWPEVWYELGFVRWRLFRRILDYFSKISYSIPVAITPLSYGYLDTLTNKYKIPRDKIVVIEHGVDTSKFRIIGRQRKRGGGEGGRTETSYLTKSNEEKNKNKKLIVYSGALSVGYDFEPVLKAAKLLEDEDVHFIIRGAGVIANELREMVANYKLTNVEVRTDLLSEEELIEFLNSADIFLLPMSFVGVIDTGLPTKTLEYQALGKPIICISKGESANYIRRTKSGLVNETRKPDDVAQLITRLVTEDHLAETLGYNGLKYITDNLTIEKIGTRFAQVISKATGAK